VPFTNCATVLRAIIVSSLVGSVTCALATGWWPGSIRAQDISCLTNPAGIPRPDTDRDADHFLDVWGCDESAVPEWGSNDPDLDDDGVQDGVEYAAGTSLWTGWYYAGDDDDGDGCANEVELAADDLDPSRDRHPGNWWDNLDVDASGDVDLSDTLVILMNFGVQYLGNGQYSGARGQELDRSRLMAPGPPAMVVEANNGVDLSEALASLFQFGWSGCSAPGPVPPEGGGVFN